MSFRDPVYVVAPLHPGGNEYEIRPEKWWSPKSRREAKRMAHVLDCLRHPAARDALGESGNRKQRRAAKAAPRQLERFQ